MARFFGTVGAEQTALDRVKVKLSPVVFTAARAGQHVRHIARQRQGAQLIDGFELRAGIVAQLRSRRSWASASGGAGESSAAISAM